MMNVEGKLGLIERHVHEAQMTWSESRFKLAKNGFCDRHPDIQLRKRNWRRKEKIVLTSCPRCDKEHELHMERMRSELEILRQQQLLGGDAYSSMNPLTPLSVQPWPPSPSEQIMQQQQQQSPASATTALAENRLAMMMATRGLGNSSSQRNQSCNDFNGSATNYLPARSSSCRACLTGIPEYGQDMKLQGACSDSDRDLSNSSLQVDVDLDLPLTNNRRPSEKFSSCRQMDVPQPSLIRRTSSSGDLPNCSRVDENWEQDLESDHDERQKSPSKHTKRDPPATRIRVPCPPATDPPADQGSYSQEIQEGGEERKEEIEQTPAPLPKPAKKTRTLQEALALSKDTDKTNNQEPNAPNSNKISQPKELSTIPSKEESKERIDPMVLAKEQEKLRKKVGAVSMEGGNTMQEMKTFAKYGMASVTDIQPPAVVAPGSPTGVEGHPSESEAASVSVLETEVKAKMNALKWTCKNAPNKAEQTLHALQALCQDSEGNQEEVMMDGGLEIVLGTMESFPAHAGVQEEAAWVLGTLANDNDDHKSLIAEKGGISSLLSAMNQLENHAEFQETALEVCHYLVDGHMLNKIAVCERVASIVAAMGHHNTNVGVLVKGISVLGNLASDCSPAQIMIAEAGGIAAIFKAMMAHKMDAGLQECGCGSIANLSCANETVKFLISQSGGIGFILAAMRNHGRDADVQEHAMFALQNLAHDSPDTKDMIIEYGGIGPVLAVTKSHRSEASAIIAACETLTTLIHRHDVAKEATVDFCGVKAMLSLLEKADAGAKVHRAACQVLMNLSHNHDKNKKRIAEAGGLTAIMSCTFNHAKNAGLLEAALKCLNSLTVIDENKILLAEACGIDVVVAAMRTHPQHSGIQEAAIRTLMNLAYCDSIRESITECGGVHAVLEAMENHLCTVVIQEKACGCLRELAVNDSNELYIVEAGGLDLIVTAMKCHEGHAGVLQNARGALRNLSFNDEGTKRQITEAMGLESADALEQFMSNADDQSRSTHES